MEKHFIRVLEGVEHRVREGKRRVKEEEREISKEEIVEVID